MKFYNPKYSILAKLQKWQKRGDSNTNFKKHFINKWERPNIILALKWKPEIDRTNT